MMLGLLLARAGVDVTVLEKHADFLRDFRGDTIHPSTLEVLHELGILDEFLRRPHQQIRLVRGSFGDKEFIIADFGTLPTHCPFIALMPQWDFLDFLATHAKRYPNFHLHMQADVTELVEEGGTVVGVRASTPDGPLEIRASLTVGADGRKSTIREQAGLVVEDIGAPIDVLWLRISRGGNDPEQLVGRFRGGHALAMIDRGDYWQCGYLIRKGEQEAVFRAGLPAFRQQLLAIAPFLGNRVEEITSWDLVKLLTVKVDRLRTWYRAGLLCIGDAAHAMSPVGGVGINLAIQDAVATANLLSRKLADDRVAVADLAQVQARRTMPTRWTQWFQVQVQNRFLGKIIGAAIEPGAPWPVRLAKVFPWLRRVPARVIGMGFRPEHVQTPEVLPPA